jgi:hypothetical protein
VSSRIDRSIVTGPAGRDVRTTGVPTVGLFRLARLAQFGAGGVQANLHALDFAEPAAGAGLDDPAACPDQL